MAIEKKSPIVLALDPRPPGNQRLPELAAGPSVQRGTTSVPSR